MIHRDHRRAYESASALGQIVHRELPRTFTWGDVDGYVRRYAGGRTLLRLVEHKQPTQKFEDAQKRVLHDLNAVIAHAVTCPPPGLRLDPASGVVVLRGAVVAEQSGLRKTHLGPQELWVPDRRCWVPLGSQEEALAWLIAMSAPKELSA